MIEAPGESTKSGSEVMGEMRLGSPGSSVGRNENGSQLRSNLLTRTRRVIEKRDEKCKGITIIFALIIFLQPIDWKTDRNRNKKPR